MTDLGDVADRFASAMRDAPVMLVVTGAVQLDLVVGGDIAEPALSLGDPGAAELGLSVRDERVILAGPDDEDRQTARTVLKLEVPTISKVMLGGGTRGQIGGIIDEIDLEILGGQVHAEELSVRRVNVMLEQSSLWIRPTESITGWSAYGSTLTVLGGLKDVAVETANAGQVLTLT